MKKIIKRTSAFLIVITFGVIIFILLLFIGDKSKGPLENLARAVDNGVAKFEKKMVGGNIREARSNSLKWFDRYRNNKVLINYPDTIFMGAYDNNTAESYESIVALEDSLQIKLPIIQLYTAWGSKKEQVFPLLRVQAIYDLGSIPMVTWEPWLNDFDIEKYPVNSAIDNVNRGGMKAVANGKYDEYIDNWAEDAKDFHAPFFLRFGHEMNDPYRYPWGPQYNKPEDFIAAWKHIADRFRKVGAENVIWLWSPHPAYTTYEQYYPGNKYVDWIAVGALNYGTVETWSKWWSFDQTFKNFYSKISPYDKPMMISEFGSLEVGGDRSAWYKQALDSLPFKYPAVKSVVFYNNSNDNTTSYKVFDWSITKDEQVIATIRNSIKKWQRITSKK
jgi:hypothetical protein